MSTKQSTFQTVEKSEKTTADEIQVGEFATVEFNSNWKYADNPRKLRGEISSIKNGIIELEQDNYAQRIHPDGKIYNFRIGGNSTGEMGEMLSISSTESPCVHCGEHASNEYAKGTRGWDAVTPARYGENYPETAMICDDCVTRWIEVEQ